MIGAEHNACMHERTDVEDALVSCHHSSSTYIGEVVQLESVRYAMRRSKECISACKCRGWVGCHDQLSTIKSMFHSRVQSVQLSV